MDGLPRLPPDAVLASAFAARAGQHDRDASFPHENFRALGEAGLLNLTTAPQDGGGGAGLARAAALVGTVAQGCASTALVLAMQLIHVHLSSRSPCWPADLRSLVGRSAAEGALINALRTEPALGTPARGGLPDTLARRTPDGWALSGRKLYATGRPGAALDAGLGAHRRGGAPRRQLPGAGRPPRHHHRADLGPIGPARDRQP